MGPRDTQFEVDGQFEDPVEAIELGASLAPTRDVTVVANGSGPYWTSSEPDVADTQVLQYAIDGKIVRAATVRDFDAICRLYSHLNPSDPPVTDENTFHTIIDRPGLDLLVLESDGEVVASTYLNIIPNLSRSAQPYAVIENVVVDESLRGTGLGRRIMAATLDRAWQAGCYKAMLQTGSQTPRTHEFYRACGFSPDEKTAYLARP